MREDLIDPLQPEPHQQSPSLGVRASVGNTRLPGGPDRTSGPWG